eukprot:m.251462 g.251462  ORF g.251462 m.251462 type:complete len:120 (-) comp92916_c0_seq1:84-443(-)
MYRSLLDYRHPSEHQGQTTPKVKRLAHRIQRSIERRLGVVELGSVLRDDGEVDGGELSSEDGSRDASDEEDEPESLQAAPASAPVAAVDTTAVPGGDQDGEPTQTRDGTAAERARKNTK